MVSQLLMSPIAITISAPSVNILFFTVVLLFLCYSVHVPQAAIADRLPQHLPTIYHGEHETDYP